jgi:hypothetical protein
MAFRKKRGEVWYVYWIEKGHKYADFVFELPNLRILGFL